VLGQRRGRAVRSVVAGLVIALTGVAIASPVGARPTQASDEKAEIVDLVRQSIEADSLKAVIVKITRGDDVVLRRAFGNSMDGVPATPNMHFRNGSVSVAYLVNLLLQYVDEQKVTLDDTIDKWYPDLPNAGTVTLKMLANQTSGYPDYETDPEFLDQFNADPFHIFTTQERLDLAFSREPFFAPGANFSYAHTNFLILGDILQKVGGKPLAELLRDEVLKPLGLRATKEAVTSGIPTPTLHTFSAERTGLYEEATFWSTQWAPPIGANETTTIDDLITTATAIGTGKLLSKASYEAMVAPNLLGFGEEQANCAPSCFAQTEYYNFGLGVVRVGDWILQDPLLSGLGVVEAYLPSEKIAIAIATTLEPGAFGPDGSYKNPASAMFKQIGAIVAPADAPPVKPAP
jgi:CubicO group peptidase (beta-lactamase class C family)